MFITIYKSDKPRKKEKKIETQSIDDAWKAKKNANRRKNWCVIWECKWQKKQN